MFLTGIFIAAMPFAFFVPHHVLGAPFHFAVCHTACSSFSFLTAAPVSFTAHLSTTPALHFIPPRSLILYCSCAWHPAQKHNTHPSQDAHALPQAEPHRSLGFISFHSVGFRSVLFSPPAATLFCSPAAPSGSVLCVLLIASVVPPVRKAAHQFTCIRQPPPYPDG